MRIKWIVFNSLMTCKMTLVTITYIMNHKHIIIESASMSTDSSNKEQHTNLNKGTLTAVMGEKSFALFLTVLSVEKFNQGNWYLPRASALKFLFKSRLCP